MSETTTTTKKRRSIVGYRTMTAAQRYNARIERLFEDCKDAQTRFNASSRTEPPIEPRAGESGHDCIDINNRPTGADCEACRQEVSPPTSPRARTATTWQELAALRIWQKVNDEGQDALSHVDYAQIISEESRQIVLQLRHARVIIRAYNEAGTWDSELKHIDAALANEPESEERQ